MTIVEKVKGAEEQLKAMQTNRELRAWAVANGMDNRSAFPKFKKALLEIGIDYDVIKHAREAEREETLESQVTHEVIMFTDAKAATQKFAVCDENGEVLWYGKFFNGEGDEQSDAELDAAKKAVWLAGKIKEEMKFPALRLILNVDASWLCYQDHAGQKGFALTILARKNNIQLFMNHIPGAINPADKFTVLTGYKKWQDNDLKSLVREKSKIEIEEMDEDEN